MSATIKPTVGRIVWFYPGGDETFHGICIDPSQPMSASIIYVASDSEVNLLVSDHVGVIHFVSNAFLYQGDGKPPGMYCTWMPYQKEQAAKAAAAPIEIQPPADKLPSNLQIGDIAGFQPRLELINNSGIADEAAIVCKVVAVTFCEGKVLYDIALRDEKGFFCIAQPLQRVDSICMLKIPGDE